MTTTVLLTLIVFYLRDGVQVKGWVSADLVGTPRVDISGTDSIVVESIRQPVVVKNEWRNGMKIPLITDIDANMHYPVSVKVENIAVPVDILGNNRRFPLYVEEVR